MWYFLWFIHWLHILLHTHIGCHTAIQYSYDSLSFERLESIEKTRHAEKWKPSGSKRQIKARLVRLVVLKLKKAWSWTQKSRKWDYIQRICWWKSFQKIKQGTTHNWTLAWTQVLYTSGEFTGLNLLHFCSRKRNVGLQLTSKQLFKKARFEEENVFAVDFRTFVEYVNPVLQPNSNDSRFLGF